MCKGITALVTAGAPRELSAAVVRFKMLAGVDVCDGTSL